MIVPNIHTCPNRFRDEGALTNGRYLPGDEPVIKCKISNKVCIDTEVLKCPRFHKSEELCPNALAKEIKVVLMQDAHTGQYVCDSPECGCSFCGDQDDLLNMAVHAFGNISSTAEQRIR